MRKQIAKKDRPELLAQALPLLLARELSQKDIAASLGIGQRTLNRWVHHDLRPQIEAQEAAEWEAWEAEQEAQRAAERARHEALLDAITTGPAWYRKA